jgi:hypothetical protein
LLIQLSVGFTVSAINIMIHALTTLATIGIARQAATRQASSPRWHLIGRDGHHGVDPDAGAYRRDRGVVR